jgi:cytochrome c-type biogenesis protein
VPIVLGTALSQHRLGPVALAAGLTLSFVAIGLFVALFGFAIGLDSGFFRAVGAVVPFTVGMLMVAPNLSTRLVATVGPVGNWAENQFGGFSAVGLWGQFGVGLLLSLAQRGRHALVIEGVDGVVDRLVECVGVNEGLMGEMAP